MRINFILSVTFICLVSVLLGGMFFVLDHAWVDFSQLEQYNPGKPSIVYDYTGKEWTRFQIDKRDIITFNNIPKILVNAFLAAEDWNFFHHKGISYKGIIRSIFVNIYHRRKMQGASTITQQLVKLLFFDAKKNFKRKIKEQFLSLIVERQFTKEKILETYLNHVCFGAGIYGIEAACQRFWGKSINDITIDESAILAGIVCSPQRYCPLYNPQNTEQRRNIILNSMHKLAFITAQQYAKAKATPVNVLKVESGTLAPHARETLRIFLEELVGKQKLYTGGLHIKTTLDVQAQEIAERIFKEHIEKLKEDTMPEIDGALVSLDGQTGGIRVLIGGYNFQLSQFNRAIQAKRQFGSTFKPLIYASAIQVGLNFADTAIDEPLTITENGKDWSPRNFNHKHVGQITLAYALSHSNNIVAIKTLLAAGFHHIAALASRCNFKDVPLYKSLALGCLDGTVCQAASMFNIFAHEGIYHEPYFIEWVKDEWDSKLYKHTPKQQRVMHNKISSQVGRTLMLSMERAKKRLGGKWLDCQAMSKTGTTNDARTCWFTGATPDLTTSIYLGCDDNKSLGQKVLAIRTAFPIWLDINKAISSKTKAFSFDPSLQEVTVHEKTGLPTNKDNSEAITILIDKKTLARNWYNPELY